MASERPAMPGDGHGADAPRSSAPRGGHGARRGVCGVMGAVPAIVLASTIALAATSVDAAARGRDPIRIVATTSDLASIAAEIGGDRVEVATLCSGSEDPHAFEALPLHMLMVKRADLLFEIGLDFEPWLDDIVLGSRNPGIRIVDCSQGIEILGVPELPKVWDGSDIHRKGNPHYWLDPANGVRIAGTIKAALAGLDPGREDEYQARLADFTARIHDKMEQWKTLLEPYREQRIVFVHDGWVYFCRAFGLEPIAYVERKPGIGPAPGDAAKIVKLLKSRETQVIVMSPLLDAEIPRRIASDSWAELVDLAPSVGAVDGAKDYLSLFDADLRLLTAAFRRVR